MPPRSHNNLTKQLNHLSVVDDDANNHMSDDDEVDDRLVIGIDFGTT